MKKAPRTLPSSRSESKRFTRLEGAKLRSSHCPGQTPQTRNKREKRRCQDRDQNCLTVVTDVSGSLFKGGQKAKLCVVLIAEGIGQCVTPSTLRSTHHSLCLRRSGAVAIAPAVYPAEKVPKRNTPCDSVKRARWYQLRESMPIFGSEAR